MISNSVVSVISFKDTEEFEAWQLTFEKPVQIIAIQPIPVSAGGSAKIDGSFDASIKLIFVVQYWKTIEVI